MKTYSEEELKELANTTFKQFPNAEHVHATVDGNTFLERNRADIHAGPKGRVFTFDRPIVTESEDSNKEKTAKIKLSAEDSIKAIGLAETLEDLKPFETDTRATVVKALQDKKAELEKPQE